MNATAESGPLDLGGLIARATLVITPLLAFNVFRLPGIVTLTMLLPLSVLTVSYLRARETRIPIWELALLAVMALSVLWGDDPNYSSERLRTYLPLALATVVAASMVPAATALRCLKLAFVVIISASVLTILLDPSTRSRAGSPDLVLTAQFSKNVYGGLLVIALLLLLDTRRRANLLIAPALVLLIAYNQSVTAWVVSFVLVVATYAIGKLTARYGPRTARPILAAMMVCGVGGTALLLLSSVNSALNAVGKDPTLGRRTQIWAACWEQIQMRPLRGHGAFTFLDAASNSSVTQFVWQRFQNYQPPHPHNGLLDLWGQLGLIGVAVFAILVGNGVRQGSGPVLRGALPQRTAVLCLIFILLFGATEPTYLGPWLIITFICASIADPRRHPALSSHPRLNRPRSLMSPTQERV